MLMRLFQIEGDFNICRDRNLFAVLDCGHESPPLKSFESALGQTERQWFNNLQNVCRPIRLNNCLQDDGTHYPRLPGFIGVPRLNSLNDRRRGYTGRGYIGLNIVIFDPWCGCDTKINVDLCERLDGFAISFRWGKSPGSQCSDRILVETKPNGFDDSNNPHAALHIK